MVDITFTSDMTLRFLYSSHRMRPNITFYYKGCILGAIEINPLDSPEQLIVIDRANTAENCERILQRIMYTAVEEK